MPGIRVLSLFDGIGTGLLALKRAGIPVAEYHAFEIDEVAKRIAKKNHPEIIHYGDVSKASFFQFLGFDLLIGGSPCQGFSAAGCGHGFDDPRSRLFWEFIRAGHEARPWNFLLENVDMKKEWQDIITRYVGGIEPVRINSREITAQNRPRSYWMSWGKNDEQIQPPYNLVALPDIIERGIDAPALDISKLPDRFKGLRSVCITEGRTAEAKAIRREFREKHGRDWSPFRAKEFFPRDDGKVNCLLTKPRLNAHTIIDETGRWRWLTPVEWERLQTLPDGYTEMEGVSTAKRFEMIGNGWTCDVIAHLLRRSPYATA